MSELAGNGVKPRVLLCECAGTMANIDFDGLEQAVSGSAEIDRSTVWCSREGQARLLEMTEADDGRPLVFAGCSQDFAARRFQRLYARGLEMEVADIREGCSWVHDGNGEAVTDKASRIIEAAIRYPGPHSDKLVRERKVDSVLVIGGGVSGTQAAAELAQMGHTVELVERRPFLAAARPVSAPSFPPTTAASACLRPMPRPACASASTETSPSTTRTCASGVAPRSSR